MSLNAFQISGPTVLVAASSSTGLAPTQLSTSPGVSQGVRLCYPSTAGLLSGQPIYVALGSSSVAAAVPTTSAPASGFPLAAGTERTILASPNKSFNWISAVTSAGTAAPGLFATPGYGQ